MCKVSQEGEKKQQIQSPCTQGVFTLVGQKRLENNQKETHCFNKENKPVQSTFLTARLGARGRWAKRLVPRRRGH